MTMRPNEKLKAVAIKTRKSKSDRRCDKKRADSYLYQWGREWWKEMRKQKYIASEKMTLGEKTLRDKYAQSGKKGRLGEAAGEWRKDRGRYWQLTRQTVLLYSLRQFLPSCHTLRLSHPRLGWDIQHSTTYRHVCRDAQTDYFAKFKHSWKAYRKEFLKKECSSDLNDTFSFCGFLSLSASDYRSGQHISFSQFILNRGSRVVFVHMFGYWSLCNLQC